MAKKEKLVAQPKKKEIKTKIAEKATQLECVDKFCGNARV